MDSQFKKKLLNSWIECYFNIGNRACEWQNFEFLSIFWHDRIFLLYLLKSLNFWNLSYWELQYWIIKRSWFVMRDGRIFTVDSFPSNCCLVLSRQKNWMNKRMCGFISSLFLSLSSPSLYCCWGRFPFTVPVNQSVEPKKCLSWNFGVFYCIYVFGTVWTLNSFHTNSSQFWQILRFVI